MSETDLNIYNVKVDDSKLNEVNKGILPALPHFLVILGRIRAGKSLILQNLYLSKRFYGDDFDVRILISSTAQNDAQACFMIDQFDFVFDHYNEELLEEILKMIETDEHDRRYLIVMDDVITDGFKQSRSGCPDRFSQLITRFRHVGTERKEGLLSIALAVQYFRVLSPIVRNNCQALILAGDFPKAEILKIADAYSYFGGSSQKFLEIFDKSRNHPDNMGYDFLYLNTQQLTARRNFKEVLWSKEQQLLDNKDQYVSDMEESQEKKKIFKKTKRDTKVHFD
jgi:hypothetical protein